MIKDKLINWLKVGQVFGWIAFGLTFLTLLGGDTETYILFAIIIYGFYAVLCGQAIKYLLTK